jgi:hypothetical protein
MKGSRRHFILQGAAALGSAAVPRAWAAQEELRFRIATDGWGTAGTAEIGPVLKSAAALLWKYFPHARLEPFVVVRGREGPIVHYQRNIMGEIVMKLDTQDYLWCQYTYQFSHEFCHILSGFREDALNRNRWFEETLCEVASLFVLRRLTDAWQAQPPVEAWRSYAPEFRHYADQVMDSRSRIGDGHLGDFYRKHRKTLENTPRERPLNGAMALPLLALLEGSPESWEAISWLNRAPSQEGDTLADYLNRWRAAVPARHRGFTGKVVKLFGLAPPSGEGEAVPAIR